MLLLSFKLGASLCVQYFLFTMMGDQRLESSLIVNHSTRLTTRVFSIGIAFVYLHVERHPLDVTHLFPI